jgi:hypothetical protein
MSVKIGKDVLFQMAGDTNTAYREVRVSLASYTGQSVSISFTGETGTGGVDYGICLDDVSVKFASKWTGNISTAWNNSGNWNTGVVPGFNDMVLIPSDPSGGRFPVIASGISAECYNISLSPGATIAINTGGNLFVKNP